LVPKNVTHMPITPRTNPSLRPTQICRISVVARRDREVGQLRFQLPGRIHREWFGIQQPSPRSVANTGGSLRRWPNCVTRGQVKVFKDCGGVIEPFSRMRPSNIFSANEGKRTSPKLCESAGNWWRNERETSAKAARR
jgi:hypothetical protein